MWALQFFDNFEEWHREEIFGHIVAQSFFSKKSKIVGQNRATSLFSVISLSQDTLGQAWDKLGQNDEAKRIAEDLNKDKT